MKIFFSVGEPSGDLHGANLIRALEEQNKREKSTSLEFVGFGGPKMAAAGCDLHTDLTQHAVMGFLPAVRKLKTFYDLVQQANTYFKESRPDAVILIDFPGFNWSIAKRAKALGIPVFYYGTPQLWAWASWRVSRMRRWVDHVLCKLPFEKVWFHQRGCNATYVGHPYFDELQTQQLDRTFIETLSSGTADTAASPDTPLVTLLPGSRDQEVEKNLASMLATVKKVQTRVPNTRFVIASFKESQAKKIRQAVTESGLSLEVYVGRTGELISAATCCLAVSGSVSLELLYHQKPSVVLYMLNRGSYLVARHLLLKVRYITLVNLLISEDIFQRKVAPYDPSDPRDADVLIPEYLTHTCKSSQYAEHLVTWLTDPQAYQKRVEAMGALKEKIGQGGASQRAADYILQELTSKTTPERSTADRNVA